MPQVSVIVPNYNRADALELTLLALAKQTISPELFEVIVVDDGSTDQSFEIIADMSVPYALQLSQQRNRGAAAARNRGAQLAQGQLLVFLDADMIAAPSLLWQYSVANELYPRAILIGRQSPWPDMYQSRFEQVTHHEWFRDLGPESFEPAFYHVLSSSMAIRRQHFTELDGFNESLGTGLQPACEDTEFGYRAQEMGLALIYVPDALAYHNHPRTFEQRCTQVYATAMWTAKMFERYPEMGSIMPTWRDIQPISWHQDRIGLIGRKMARQFLALSPVLSILRLASRLVERWRPNPFLLRFLYWRILGGYRVAGFRTGQSHARGGRS